MTRPQIMVLSPLTPAALSNLEGSFEVLRCAGVPLTNASMAQLAVDNVIAHFQNEPHLSSVDRPIHTHMVPK